MKNLIILGSTGSIGTQTLDIVREHKNEYSVTALAAGSNAALIEKQIREFKVKTAVLYDETAAGDLKNRVKDTDCRILSGMEGLLEAAAIPEGDIVVGAMVGMIGIRPTLAAIRAGKDIALANKETLVCAGHIIMEEAKRQGVKILPVDSEHSAIFQSLRAGSHDEIEKILLTASGGPFLGKKPEEIKNMTAKEALKHPNWDMGPKVTIDSASLVNKGLEVMEARWLFDVPVDMIEVVIHPQSIIHSMVQFTDGAVIAQLGLPDMHLPIQYALSYPKRLSLNAERTDFFKLKQLTFLEPDKKTFRGLDLALKAAKKGGSYPTVFNASNEAAVKLFIEGRIGFCDIYDVIEKAMEEHGITEAPDIDDILRIEEETKNSICL